MASRCPARVPSPRSAPRHGWAVSRFSARPTKCRASGGRSVICAAVSFRPCIDIHKGKVKQIVGSTLRDSSNDGTALVTNFESDKSAAEFAKLYKEDELFGGHVIMLGADPASQASSLEALRAYPGGLQVGGGINLENAMSYLNEGASHVIVTSYVFSNGKMNIERLRKLVELVGKQRLVLDLSCRKKDGRTLLEMFPLLQTKETLASEEELAPFKNFSSRMAAIDYSVCAQSEVFVTTQGGNFPHFLMGHRRYLYGGHSKTIKPDKRRLAILFDNQRIGWKSLKRHLLNMRAHSDTKGIEMKRPNESIYTFPCPDCMCCLNRTEHSKPKNSR